MRFVTSVVMVKQDQRVTNTQNVLYKIHANSQEEAKGMAIEQAQKDFPEHNFHTCVATEVGAHTNDLIEALHEYVMNTCNCERPNCKLCEQRKEAETLIEKARNDI